MRLHSPRIVEDGGLVKLTATLESRKGSIDVWFGVEPALGDALDPDRLDGFLAAVLAQAVQDGEDLIVDGPVSSRLVDGLAFYAPWMMRTVFPDWRVIRIHATEPLDDADVKPATGVAAGFTGGVDSFTILVQQGQESTPARMRLTHLLFMNAGSHGQGGRLLYQERYERLRPCAEELGLPFIQIDSNLAQALDVPFIASHTLRHVGAVLGLRKLIGRYIYGATYPIEASIPAPDNDIARLDLMLLPLLSTAGLECWSGGPQLTRFERTALVADYAPSHHYLDVCTRPHGVENCSACRKCLRTLITLELIGALDRYRTVFDLDRYRRERRALLVRILSRPDQNPWFPEILEEMRARELPLPPGLRLEAWLRRLTEPAIPRVPGSISRQVGRIRRNIQL